MKNNTCIYKVEYRGSGLELVLDCRSCNRTDPSKLEPCFNRIINTVQNEHNIDSILMCNHSFTKFHSDAVALLKNFAKLRIELKDMSARKFDPANHSRIHNARGQTREYDRCRNCEFDPVIFFSTLQSMLYLDFDGFFDLLITKMDRINAGLISDETTLGRKIELDPANPISCHGCIAETFKDLTYLFKCYKALVDEIVQKGFAVVGY